MAASRVVQARVPGEIQDAAHAVIQASGLTVSAVVRGLMTRIARDKSIPTDLFEPDAETIAAMRDARAGKNMKSFATVEDLMADLHAEDGPIRPVQARLQARGENLHGKTLEPRLPGVRFRGTASPFPSAAKNCG